MKLSNGAINRRTIRHTFGNSKPQAGLIGFGAFTFPENVYVSDNVYSSQHSESQIRNCILNQRLCFANFGDVENGYWNNSPDSVAENHLINIDPITENDNCSSEEDFQDTSQESTEPLVKYELEGMSMSDDEMDDVCEKVEEFSLETSNASKPDKEPASQNAPSTHSLPCLSSPSLKPDDKDKSPLDYPVPPSAPSVTTDMLTINEAVLHLRDKDDVIVEDKPFKIKQHELACFVPGPGQWLHDIVVDYYLELITRRSKADIDGKYAKVYSFMSTFYPLLAATDGLNAVKETTNGVNIFENELIFFPVCQSSHWRLVVVNVLEKTVKVYNSGMPSLIKKLINLAYSPDEIIATKIVDFLKEENKRIHSQSGDSFDSFSGWIIELNLEDIPHQDNGDDCGIYTLQFADYLSRRAPFDFNVDHILYFRYKMLYECITNRLLT